MDAVRKFQEFAIHALVKAIDSSHPITDLENGPDALHPELFLIFPDFFPDDGCDFFRSEFHGSVPLE
jgi:hypothetical protein